MTVLRQGYLEIVCLLLEVSAHTDLQSHASCTAVSARLSRDMWRSHACYWKPGQTKMRKQGMCANLVSKKNRDKDLQNRRGDTALMTASRQGHLEIVCLLLEVSAHTDLQRHASYTAVSARCSRDMWRSHACYWKPGQTQMRKQGDGGGI